ncbi:MAG: glycosyltransferase [Pikeienuella sp.]
MAENGAAPAASPAVSPAVSIVIPHYNQPDGLALGLASLAAQISKRSIEVLVVDNGSQQLPDAVCARFPFVRLMREPSRGPGPARSTGARAARAPVIAFLDADCTADPDWVARLLDRFAADPSVDILGGAVRIAFADPTQPTAIEGFEEVFAYRQQLFIERDGYCATCNMAVRAQVFAEVGPFGGLDIAEDLDWGQRATALGKQIVYAREMRIATPARASFAEVRRKLDRQVGHDYVRARTRKFGRLRWALKTVAMPLSPLAEIRRIASAERLRGLPVKAGTFVVLVRTRLWRARRMAELLAGRDPTALSAGWRRTTA